MKKEAKRSEKARSANEKFRRLKSENRSLAPTIEGFHRNMIEPSLRNLSDSLGLVAKEPDTHFFEKDLSATTTLIVMRDTACDFEITATTSVKNAVTGGRKVLVSLSSEKKVSKRRLGQAVARISRQSQIASRSKSFPLSDLDYANPLSSLTRWFHETIKEFAVAHTHLIAEEGR